MGGFQKGEREKCKNENGADPSVKKIINPAGKKENAQGGGRFQPSTVKQALVQARMEHREDNREKQGGAAKNHKELSPTFLKKGGGSEGGHIQNIAAIRRVRSTCQKTSG